MNKDERSIGRVSRLRTLARTLLKELELAEELEQDVEIQLEVDFYEEVKRFEIELITKALMHSRGHQLEAAHLIKLNPSTLNAKIKHYGIQVNMFSEDVGSNLDDVDSSNFGTKSPHITDRRQ